MAKRGRQPRKIKRRKDTPGLAQRIFAGPPAHKEGVERARELERVLARKRKAWELYCDGATIEQISDQFTKEGVAGCSVATVWRDLMAYRSAREREAAEDAEMRREAQMHLMRRIRRANVPLLYDKRHGKAAADAILGTLHHEARLYGLSIERNQTVTVEQLARVVHGLVQFHLEMLQDEAVRQQVLQNARRLVKGVVDVGREARPVTIDVPAESEG